MAVMKVDFHTHSVASPDGSLTLDDYRQELESAGLDCIAITDHNTIELALAAYKQLGDRIIVGEEVTTLEGEIIGLYLTKAIPAMLSASETVRLIHEQGGLVYVPHPFETVRKGISQQTLDAIADGVDIIELHNGRAVFQNLSRLTGEWAKRSGMPGAAGSDAHGRIGWGRTYTVLADMPVRGTILPLLQSATYVHNRPAVRAVLYPKFNRLRKWVSHA